MFEYTFEVLEIIRNPNDVMMIKTIKGKEGKYLAAWLTNGDVLQLTNPKSAFTYPFQPFAYLNQQLAQGYWENFEILWEDVAINKNYIENLFTVIVWNVQNVLIYMYILKIQSIIK